MARPRLYLVAPAEAGKWKLADLVGDLAGAGVDLIQLRDKDVTDLETLRAAEAVAAACADASVPLIVNDRIDIALATGADGVHLGQADLTLEAARRIMPVGLVGRSTHSTHQIDSELGAPEPADYIAVGPVYETPTKPGRPATGLDLVRYASQRATLPWFAIGGIDRNNLPEVMAAGARRIVVVRAITESPDPPGAAAELRVILDSLPL